MKQRPILHEKSAVLHRCLPCTPYPVAHECGGCTGVIDVWNQGKAGLSAKQNQRQINRLAVLILKFNNFVYRAIALVVDLHDYHS